ncbi:TadE/TadG family type IV pilus assembly protein [Crenobacter intestini]|uniref:Pilus assembly protein n=1 Tax=Crenobacter intestini TaxID=2563443 RepID=A0A4T0V263_9NEIS|nr:TadE/TadG family type IV pilus assembly protein [Crenobacter intestini]TIC85246.1 pilus assembly protein [Crenobacter intestini]
MSRPSRRQAGTTSLEFALIAVVFFSVLLGIFEFGRLLFTWNSAVEATRRSARLAVVCNMDAPRVKQTFREILPAVSANDISVDYTPADCKTLGNCQAVTVSVSPNAPMFRLNVPLLSTQLRLPPFSTTLLKESMATGSGSDQNPDCL